MKTRVAVVGTGAMGKGIVSVIKKQNDMEVVAIADIDPKALERTKPYLSKGALVTTEPSKVLDVEPDILIDATPTILEAALLSKQAIEQKINVILMNGEVDQVFGRYLAEIAKSKGVILTSDSGDQHGVLARQYDEIISMGLEIVLSGNNKGFLYEYANPESIVEEAAKRKLTVNQCTAYTDGTKLAIEMAILANAKNLTLLEEGMKGPRADSVQDSLNQFDLELARDKGGVVDYVLGARPGGSVFTIAFSDDPDERFYMNYYKMGNGPYYVFLRPYHLCHFETPHTIREIVFNNRPILVQQKRVLEVGTRAKKDLEKGTKLDGIGGFNTYGVLETPKSLPIGLSEDMILTRSKKKDEPIYWEDVEFDGSDLILDLWEKQKN